MADQGIRNLDLEPYKGLDSIKGSFIPTGIYTLDEAMNDLMPGCVTLIGGGPNEGKTTFVKQIVVNAINRGNKVFLMHGEGNQERLINELYRVVIGRDPNKYDLVQINKKYHKEPKKEALPILKQWHKNKLTLFSKTKSSINKIDDLFKMIELEVVSYKYNLVVIDNLMSMLTAKAVEKNEEQGEFMQKCHELADKYSIHIILVLHPNKEYRKGMKPEMVYVAGSSDLYNKADYVIWVSREYDEQIRTNGIHGHFYLLKNRDYPTIGQVDVTYDIETGLLLELKDGKAYSYKFNIEQNNIPVKIEEDFSLPFDL